MGRKLLWLQWKTSHPPGAGRAHSAHQVPARETEPEDTAGAGCPARMLGSRLDTLKCQAGPEGSRGAEVTIRSVQDPRGAQTEEAGGFSITWCPRGCLGGVTPGIGSRLQQQDLASRCLQTAGQGSGQGAWEPRAWRRPLPVFSCCSIPQSCPTLCDPVDCSTPGLPVHRQLLEFTQTHGPQVGDAI